MAWPASFHNLAFKVGWKASSGNVLGVLFELGDKESELPQKSVACREEGSGDPHPPISLFEGLTSLPSHL